MGDSEDDYERKSVDRHDRNKFHRERKGDTYPKRHEERRRGSEKAEFKNQNCSKSVDYQDYVKKRERYYDADKESSETRARGARSPPTKRSRTKQWNDGPRDPRRASTSHSFSGGERLRGPNMYVNPNFIYPNPTFFQQPFHNVFPPRPCLSRMPPAVPPRGVLTFKAFLSSQEDDISDDDARAKYRKYRREYERAELQDFFKEHNQEEWFIQKYHPDEMVKAQNEKTDAVKSRLKVFMDYYQMGGLKGVSLDATDTIAQLSFMEKVGILLEGGTVEDFVVLDTPTDPVITEEDSSCASSKEIATATTCKEKKVTDKTVKVEKDDGKRNEAAEPAACEDVSLDLALVASEDNDCSSFSGSYFRSHGVTDSDVEAEGEEPNGPIEPLPPGIDPASRGSDGRDVEANATERDETAVDVYEDLSNDDAEPPVTATPLPVEPVKLQRSGIHQLGSLFIRSLPPSVTKQEVEAICRKFPGFMRVAMADPTPERRFFRRAWITFTSCEHLKDTIVQMNNIKLRNCYLGAIVNRSLVKRIRVSTALTADPQAVKHDVKLAAQLAHCQDVKHGLWGETARPGEQDTPLVLRMVSSKNPFLANVLDYITEVASAEEDSYVGGGLLDDQADCDGLSELTEFLDRLLLYLRVVHSVDYYNCSEYVNEHQMPNRCGILYVRGQPIDGDTVSRDEVASYNEEMQLKVAKTFLQPAEIVSETELVGLGLKDKEIEVERFVESNTTKLATDKWLCRLSGKKFSAPAYVRKHIFNKHEEKLEDIRKNVDFYNNYLRDSKRPKVVDPCVLAQAEMIKRREGMPVWATRDHGRGFHHGPMPSAFCPAPFMFPTAFRGGFNRGRGAIGFTDSSGRPITNYRDLDSPANDADDIF